METKIACWKNRWHRFEVLANGQPIGNPARVSQFCDISVVEIPGLCRHPLSPAQLEGARRQAVGELYNAALSAAWEREAAVK